MARYSRWLTGCFYVWNIFSVLLGDSRVSWMVSRHPYGLGVAMIAMLVLRHF